MAVTTERTPAPLPHALDIAPLSISEAAQVYSVHPKTIQQADMPPEEPAIVRMDDVQAALESLYSSLGNVLYAFWLSEWE